jgi:hypothetical protein
VFKNKRVLMEAVHKQKAEKVRAAVRRAAGLASQAFGRAGELHAVGHYFMPGCCRSRAAAELGRTTPTPTLTPTPFPAPAALPATHPPQIREKNIADQLEARRAKNKASRERKAARREERLAAGVPAEAAAKPAAAAPAAAAPAKAAKASKK